MEHNFSADILTHVYYSRNSLYKIKKNKKNETHKKYIKNNNLIFKDNFIYSVSFGWAGSSLPRGLFPLVAERGCHRLVVVR